MPALPPILSFVAPSGTGKTTLLEGVIASLAARGLRVGVLKHDAHRLILDKPGKDTFRFRQAGAWRAVIASSEQLGLFGGLDGATSVGGLVDAWLSEADLVLTEGFRRSGLPVVRVHRAAAADPTWEAPAAPIAWVSDVPVDTDVPVLPLDDPEAVARFVVATLLPDDRAANRATLVLPVASASDAAAVPAVVDRLGPACDEVLAVRAADVAVPLGVPAVVDLAPGLGPLGALLTALAIAPTPEVVFVGSRFHHVAPGLVALLRGAGRADVVVPVDGPWAEPLLARYGHRCLGAIKAALLSGEPRMDGWWGQVRVRRLPAEAWRPLV